MKKPKAAPKPKAARPAPAAAAKPPPWHPVPVAQQRRQHRAAVKAAASRKKHATASKTAAKPVRKLAPGEAAACCSAEALAASLRLAGHRVPGADVLALYRHTADDPDAGAPILVTLEAAAEYGLAGVRPVSFAPADLDAGGPLILGLELPAPHAVCDDGTCWRSWGQRYSPPDFPGAVISETWTVTWPGETGHG